MEKSTRYEKETMRYKASSFVVVENCTNEYSICEKRRKFCELLSRVGRAVMSAKHHARLTDV